MSADYTLYCVAQSGNAYKAALMLNLCGADWTPRFVDFFAGEMRTEAYRAINVMGEVPVLEHRGQRLSRSGMILDYLAHTLGRFDWKSYPVIGAWLRRLESLPGWKHPYDLMPGHPLPAKG